MIIKSGIWLAEYSLTQDAMHVHEVNHAMRKNFQMIMDGQSTEYMVIGVADSHEEASAICDALRDRLNAENRPGVAGFRCVTCQFCGKSFVSANLDFCFVCEHLPEMCSDCLAKHDLSHSPAEEAQAVAEMLA